MPWNLRCAKRRGAAGESNPSEEEEGGMGSLGVLRRKGWLLLPLLSVPLRGAQEKEGMRGDQRALL